MNNVVAIFVAIIAYIGSLLIALLLGAGMVYAKHKGVDFDDMLDDDDDDELWAYEEETDSDTDSEEKGEEEE